MILSRRSILWASSSAVVLMLWGTAALPCERRTSFGPTNPPDGARSIPANSKLFVTVWEGAPEDVEAKLNDPHQPVSKPLGVTVLAPGLVMVDLPKLDPKVEYSADVRLAHRQRPDPYPIRVSFQATDTPDLKPPRWNSAHPVLSTRIEAVNTLPDCDYSPGYRVRVEFPTASDDNLAAYVLYVEDVDGVRAADIAFARPEHQSRLRLHAYSHGVPSGCYFVKAFDLAGHNIRIGQPSCTPSRPPMDPPAPPIEPLPMKAPGNLAAVEPGCRCTSSQQSNATWALLLLAALVLRPARHKS